MDILLNHLCIVLMSVERYWLSHTLISLLTIYVKEPDQQVFFLRMIMLFAFIKPAGSSPGITQGTFGLFELPGHSLSFGLNSIPLSNHSIQDMVRLETIYLKRRQYDKHQAFYITPVFDSWPKVLASLDDEWCPGNCAEPTQTAKFMGPAWGPHGSCRT